MRKFIIFVLLWVVTLPISAQLMFPGVVASSIQTSSSSPLLDSLVAYWSLDETSGTTANDSYASFDGTLNGATFVSGGKLGYGVQFGNENSIIVPYAAGLSPSGTTMSIGGWFKVSALASVTGHSYVIASLYDATFHSTHELIVDKDDDKVYFSTTNTTETTYYVSSGAVTVSVDTWYHAVGVVRASGSAVELYVNNVKTEGNVFSGTLHAIDSHLGIGNDNIWYSRNMLGIIDEVIYSGQAFTVSDISLLWNSGAGLAFPF